MPRWLWCLCHDLPRQDTQSKVSEQSLQWLYRVARRWEPHASISARVACERLPYRPLSPSKFRPLVSVAISLIRSWVVRYSCTPLCFPQLATPRILAMGMMSKLPIERVAIGMVFLEDEPRHQS
eukprot:COSAG01_NODE_10665_length_2109_cov_1.913433_2_plen_124_part_00